MGMYTELVIKGDIKQNIPPEVKLILDFLFNPETNFDIWEKGTLTLKKDVIIPDHTFFKCPRWTAIGRMSSYYHIPACCNFFDGRYLFSRSDLKNYDNEIEKFINWVNPYLDEVPGKCIGWSWYEESDQPTLIYMK